MPRVKLLFLSLLLLTYWGCGRDQGGEAQLQESAEQAAEPADESAPLQSTAEQSAEIPKAEPKPVRRTETASREVREPEPSAPVTRREPEAVTPAAKSVVETAAAPPAEATPQPRYATVPSGTRLEVRLSDGISSADNQSGDSFETTLDEDLRIDGRLLAPRGSIVMGKLSNVQQSGRVEGRATMSMNLSELLIGNDSYPIRTNTLSFEAEGTQKRDATKIGAGAGIGALIGAIAGGKKGAAIGAAIGGGAGTASVLATRGKEVEFEGEQLFSFVLSEDLQIKLQ